MTEPAYEATRLQWDRDGEVARTVVVGKIGEGRCLRQVEAVSATASIPNAVRPPLYLCLKAEPCPDHGTPGKPCPDASS